MTENKKSLVFMHLLLHLAFFRLKRLNRLKVLILNKKFSTYCIGKSIRLSLDLAIIKLIAL